MRHTGERKVCSVSASWSLSKLLRGDLRVFADKCCNIFLMKLRGKTRSLDRIKRVITVLFHLTSLKTFVSSINGATSCAKTIDHQVNGINIRWDEVFKRNNLVVMSASVPAYVFALFVCYFVARFHIPSIQAPSRKTLCSSLNCRISSSDVKFISLDTAAHSKISRGTVALSSFRNMSWPLINSIVEDGQGAKATK